MYDFQSCTLTRAHSLRDAETWSPLQLNVRSDTSQVTNITITLAFIRLVKKIMHPSKKGRWDPTLFFVNIIPSLKFRISHEMKDYNLLSREIHLYFGEFILIFLVSEQIKTDLFRKKEICFFILYPLKNQSRLINEKLEDSLTLYYECQFLAIYFTHTLKPGTCGQSFGSFKTLEKILLAEYARISLLFGYVFNVKVLINKLT